MIRKWTKLLLSVVGLSVFQSAIADCPLVQAGTGAYVNGQHGSTHISLPCPMPDAQYAVTFGNTELSNANFFSHNKSATGFDVDASAFGAFDWIAVHY